MHRWNIRHLKEITLILYARFQSLIKSLRDTILGYVWCQNDISEKPFPVKLDILYNKCSKIKMWNGSEMGERKRKMDNVKCEIEYHMGYWISNEKCVLGNEVWILIWNWKWEILKQKLWHWNWIVTLELKCDIGIEMRYWNCIVKMDIEWEMWTWKHEIYNVEHEMWNWIWILKHEM